MKFTIFIGTPEIEECHFHINDSDIPEYLNNVEYSFQYEEHDITYIFVNKKTQELKEIFVDTNYSYYYFYPSEICLYCSQEKLISSILKYNLVKEAIESEIYRRLKLFYMEEWYSRRIIKNEYSMHFLNDKCKLYYFFKDPEEYRPKPFPDIYIFYKKAGLIEPFLQDCSSKEGNLSKYKYLDRNVFQIVKEFL